jgi:prefoldin subunit 5
VSSPRTPASRAFAAASLLCLALATAPGKAFAQQSAAGTANASPDVSLRDLDSQLRELRATIAAMRAENEASRAEMRQLRQELQDTRKLLTPLASSPSVPPASVAPSVQPGSTQAETIANAATADLDTRVQKLEESTQLMGSKIDEQYQTKVETAAKYRARLSGIILMNAFRNVGGSDSLDIPNYAQPVPLGSPQASLGATLRQTEIGLEVFGPSVAGARTSANIQFDFAGGFPATANAVNFGIARLQTGTLRLDWEHTSIVAGQDNLFFSPLSPTSFASLATPAFAYAGNLWGWTPQVRVEHRFDLADQQTLTLQAGVMDNLDWEGSPDSYYRSAQAGENSGQPAYALRTAWSRPLLGHPLTFGAAGYYGRQNWSSGRYVDAWAAMSDWQIPLARRVHLSGEFYRGRGVGGLGAAIGQSIVYGGSPVYANSPIRGVDSAGGWAQLKFQLTPKLEFNGTLAEDDAFTANIRGFATDSNNFSPILGRNRGALGNVIYRPRSDLLLAAELRRLRTFPVYSAASATNQLNLSMGILF